MYQFWISELMNDFGHVVTDIPLSIRENEEARIQSRAGSLFSSLCPASYTVGSHRITDLHPFSSVLLLAAEHILSLLSCPDPFFVPGMFSASSSFFRLWIRL